MSHPIPGQENDEHYRGEHESERQQAKRLGGGSLGKSIRRKFDKVKSGAKRDGRKEALHNIKQERFGRAFSKLAKKRTEGGPVKEINSKLGTKGHPFPEK